LVVRDLIVWDLIVADSIVRELAVSGNVLMLKVERCPPAVDGHEFAWLAECVGQSHFVEHVRCVVGHVRDEDICVEKVLYEAVCHVSAVLDAIRQAANVEVRWKISGEELEETLIVRATRRMPHGGSDADVKDVV
jgi:hypothetical protein